MSEIKFKGELDEGISVDAIFKMPQENFHLILENKNNTMRKCYTRHSNFKLALLLFGMALFTLSSNAQPKMENLGRGLLAIQTSSGVYLTWRLLGSEPYETSFDVYKDGTKITNAPIDDRTNYTDASGSLSSTYQIVSVYEGANVDTSEIAEVLESPIMRIDLDVPATVGNTTYSPNDCSTADLDGDGEYEIIVKWNPSNAKDNSQSGYTDKVYLDAYKLDGTKLWRIDLGVNIRAGAHYSPFMVYDFDGDGKAEMACKTAPGTIDGTGTYLQFGPAASADHSADYRNNGGYILTGPEYLTLFDGETGAELSTLDYTPPRGNVSSWGDSYGNRVDRFLAGVAYLDGETASLVMCRGYYTRTVVAAYDWDGQTFSQRWVFDSNNNTAYAGQGNHQLSIQDVDADGKQEIIYGSMTLDDDGTGLYNTTYGHGDALHVTDMDPDRPGLEVFAVHEETSQPYGVTFRDAGTGEVIWGFDSDYDIGRGVAADIVAEHKGYEMWSSANGNLYNCKGEVISTSLPVTAGGGASYNHLIWWDGDLLRELLDRTVLNKYVFSTGGSSRLYTLYNEGVSANNGSKSNPCLTADLFGDWREEIILRSSTDDQLVIFNTTIPSSHKIYTLMHDPAYRVAIAWQNVGYNQPPHPGYYLGEGMETPTKPEIQFADVAVVKPRHKLIVATEGFGTVSSQTGSYVEGDITITATPEEGWVFDGWTGDTTSTDTELVLALNTDKSITAVFSMEDAYGWNSYEAEEGVWSDATIDTNRDGYSGTGFVNTANAKAEWVTVTVYAPFAGDYDARFVYNYGGTDDRSCILLVNGKIITAGFSMPGLGDWSLWDYVETTVTLNEGENTIRLYAVTEGGLVNYDKIDIKYQDVTATNELEWFNNIRCYPTVVSSVLNVEVQAGNTTTGTLSIYNMNGQLCKSKTLNTTDSNIITLDLADLNAGVYVIKVDDGVHISTQKIIKK